MYLLVLYIALVGHLSMAVPLASPVQSSDLAQFFDSRILGGEDAPDGINPSMVALVFGEIFHSFLCGGSLTTSTLVLTAAHCIEVILDWNGNLMRAAHARLGSNFWYDGDVVQFAGHEIHADYHPWLLKNDIGFLVLAKSVEFTPRVQPIQLERGFVGADVPARVTGWGTTRLSGPIPDRLQYLEVMIISDAQCQKLAYEASTVLGMHPPPINSSVEICTFHSPGHGMCHGDSGSALMSKETNALLGVVSWGFPCAIGGPDMFARNDLFFFDKIFAKYSS